MQLTDVRHAAYRKCRWQLNSCRRAKWQAAAQLTAQQLSYQQHAQQLGSQLAPLSSLLGSAGLACA